MFTSLRAQSNFLSEAKFLQGDITDRCLCSLLLKTLETGVCCSLTTWMIRKFLNHFNLCFEHHPYLKDRFVIFSGFCFGHGFSLWFGCFLHFVNNLKTFSSLFICVFFHVVFMVARRERISIFKRDRNLELLLLSYYGNCMAYYLLFKGSSKLEVILFRSMSGKKFQELWGRRGWWDPKVESRVWMSF